MSSITKILTDALASEKVITDPEILKTRRHDYWVLSHLDNIQDRPTPAPACVVRPTSTEDVVKIVNACSESKTPLIPFGLGSGVVGGVITTPEHVLLDLSSMNKIRNIDETNYIASFDAGYNGGEAECAVQKKGLTIGHWPQSIDISSVGGWIATRASGQFSTAYGNIEDIVYSIEAVLPDGSIINAGKAPRASAGPDLRHLLLGSEGTLAVITGVSLSLRKLPEVSLHSAFYAPNMKTGLEFQREVMQTGYAPPVMRLYDSTEAARNFPAEHKDDAAIFFAIHEGPQALAEAEQAGVTAIAKTHGLEEAPTQLVEQWLGHRNTVPTWQTFFEKGIILDTIEISSSWDTINAIYEAATASVREVPGVLAATAHSSHAYRTGINLYFTFAARPDNSADMADTYRECWKRVLDATAAHGGGIAHHHGIGRVRKDYLVHDVGEVGIQTLRKLKQTLDPHNIMNPGVLLPDA
ncbi:MAG: FAD-binding oxidoreductase [Candidatus Hydrogenedentota bacterium]